MLLWIVFSWHTLKFHQILSSLLKRNILRDILKRGHNHGANIWCFVIGDVFVEKIKDCTLNSQLHVHHYQNEPKWSRKRNSCSLIFNTIEIIIALSSHFPLICCSQHVRYLSIGNDTKDKNLYSAQSFYFIRQNPDFYW